jgi:hypothetical protein
MVCIFSEDEFVSRNCTRGVLSFKKRGLRKTHYIDLVVCMFS